MSESEFEFSINLPRSSWNNLTDRPKEFSLEIEVYSSQFHISFSITLFRLTKEIFPSIYGPFFQDKLTWTEKSDLMRTYNEDQISEIDKYRHSLNWYYDTEQSLIEILNEVKEQVINVAVPTIVFGIAYIRDDLDIKFLYRKMSKHSTELYLNQLDIDSRFPLD